MNAISKEFGQVLNINESEILSCEHIGGLSNKNYLFKTTKGDFVYRKASQNEFINRHHEYKILKYIQEFDVKTLFFDKDSGDKITIFLPSAKILQIPLNDKILSELAFTLASLHVKKTTFNSKFDFINECEKYEKNISIKNLSTDFLTIKKNFLQTFKTHEFITTLTLCHNDLVLENILLHGDKIHIIDWEFSSLNHPSWDLAVLFLEANLTPYQEKYFLKNYLKIANQTAKMQDISQEIKLQKRAYKIICYLWAMSKSKEDKAFLTYANQSLSWLRFKK